MPTANHDDNAQAREVAASQLPEYWPTPTPPEPVRSVWIPWPVAVMLVPLFWLMPKRMGPHFAAVRWPGAIVAHLVWTIYGIGCIAIAFEAPRYSWVAYLAGQVPGQKEPVLWGPPTLSEIFRAPLAVLADWITTGITEPGQLILGIFLLIGAELLVFAAAWLLVPYAAAGERLRKLYTRCAKLTLWSTTSLVVLGLALQASELKAHHHGRMEIILAFYAAWLVWIWIRSGIRYAGPAEGPAWEPQPPRCEDCGYRLTGLAPSGCCPECGVAIAQSLPEHRQPSPFALASSTLGRIPAFLRTLAAVLFDRTFFKRVAINGQHAAARHFAVWMCLFTSSIIAVGFLSEMWMDRHGIGSPLSGVGDAATALTMAFIWSAAICPLVVSLVATVGMIFGYRSMQHHATAVFYHAAWLLPLVVSLFILCFSCAYVSNSNWYDSKSLHLWSRTRIATGDLVIAILVGSWCVVSLLILSRLSRAIRQTRFANG